MTKSELEAKLFYYSKCLPCGSRLMFVKNGNNPVKKVNCFKMNYRNLYDISSNYAVSYYVEKENMKYRGVPCSEDNKIANNEIYVDIDLQERQNYKGLLDMAFFSVLHEAM